MASSFRGVGYNYYACETFEDVTDALPDTLVLIANNRVNTRHQLDQLKTNDIETFYPWDPDRRTDLGWHRHCTKQLKLRWEHFHSVTQGKHGTDDRICVRVAVWAPMMPVNANNVVVWGYLFMPAYLGHHISDFTGIRKGDCVPDLPTLCQAAGLDSIDSLYDAPQSECTLPDLEKALHHRIGLYCKLKKNQPLTMKDVMVVTQEDIDRDRLSFNAVLLGLDVRSPCVLTAQHTCITFNRPHGVTQEGILAEVVRYEMAILQTRLRSCFSHRLKSWFLAAGAREVDEKEEVEEKTPSLAWFSSMFESRHPRPLFHYAFEKAHELIAARSVELSKGRVTLHMGHAYHLLRWSIARQVITHRLSYISGRELHDERLVALLRAQLGRLWSVNHQVLDKTEELRRKNAALGDLKKHAPPCVVQMIQSVAYPTVITTLPYMDHRSRFLFSSIGMRYGVSSDALLVLLKDRVEKIYPRSEWDKRKKEEEDQMSYLVRTKKLYLPGCKSMQEKGKYNRTWCLFTTHAQPQHKCASRLSAVEGDSVTMITSPWMFITEKEKRTKKAPAHVSVMMDLSGQ